MYFYLYAYCIVLTDILARKVDLRTIFKSNKSPGRKKSFFKNNDSIITSDLLVFKMIFESLPFENIFPISEFFFRFFIKIERRHRIIRHGMWG